MATMRGAQGQDLVSVTNYSKKQTGGCRHLPDDWDDLVIVRKQCFMYRSVSRASAHTLFHPQPRGVQVAPLTSTQTHDCISACPGANRDEAEETLTQAIHL